MFFFLWPIRAPLAFYSPPIISVYKCGLDLHTDVHTDTPTPPPQAETKSSSFTTEKNNAAFCFSLHFSFLHHQTIVQKTTVGSRIIWSVTTWMRLTKAKQWSLKKLRHSVFVLHQLTFIESHTVCVSPPHPSRQTVWHHKLTFDNNLYTSVCQCDYGRCMPRCLHCQENISVSLKFGGGEKSFSNAASHKCSTSHSQIHMPYDSGNCIGSPKTNFYRTSQPWQSTEALQAYWILSYLSVTKAKPSDFICAPCFQHWP